MPTRNTIWRGFISMAPAPRGTIFATARAGSALLGQMLFNGDQLPRQAARGLMWLTLARDSATPDETWIKESYNKAIARASDDDRAMALQMLEHWVQGRKD